MHIERTTLILIVIASTALAAACGSDGGGGDGNLSVVLEAEETIPEGLQSGDCDECILDGYSVSFSRYAVAVGFVDMSQVGGANPQSSSVVGIADFTSLSGTPELTAFSGIPTGQYTSFGYETPIPESSAINVNEVDGGVVNAMVQEGHSYYIEGTLERESDGETIDFFIAADVPAVYTDCALDGAEQGVPVAANSSVDITIHGDHIFFNGFPNDEANVQRLAAWMWRVGEERDTDGVISQDDFEAATNVDELFPQPPAGDYELDRSPVRPINNAWDFVRAQLGTQGHIFGEGECQWGDLDEM